MLETILFVLGCIGFILIGVAIYFSPIVDKSTPETVPDNVVSPTVREREYERYLAERKQEYERCVALAEAKYHEKYQELDTELSLLQEEFLIKDTEARTEAKTYIPLVETIEYPAGTFMRVDEEEVPIRYIEDITGVMHEQSVNMGGISIWNGTSYWSEGILCHSLPSLIKPHLPSGTITVRMISGAEYTVECSAYKLDILLGAMREKWRSTFSS